VFNAAKDDGGGADNWTTGAKSHAKPQSNHHHQQTKIQFLLQAGCPSCHPTNSCQSTEGKKLLPIIILTTTRVKALGRNKFLPRLLI